MKTRARVVALLGNDLVTVEIDRRAACDGCHKNEEGQECSVCTLLGGSRTLATRAKNRAGAAVGDLVEVESATSRMMLYAVLVFLLPLVVALAGYCIARAAALGEVGALLVAGGGFLLSLVGVAVYSKIVAARRTDVTVVAILDRGKDAEGQ